MKVFFYMEYYSGSIVLPYLNNFNLHVFYIVTLLIEMDIAVKKNEWHDRVVIIHGLQNFTESVFERKPWEQ